jgi:hypothetical protein
MRRDGERVPPLIEAHSPLLGRALRSCTPLAGGAITMTLGHVVIGQNASALDLTRAHERVHVRQYELWGPFFLPAYLLAGVFELLRGRHPYIDNYFERDARGAEKGVGRVFARRARIGTKNRGGTFRPSF